MNESPTLDDLRQLFEDFGPYTTTLDGGWFYVPVKAVPRLDRIRCLPLRGYLINRRGFSVVAEEYRDMFLGMHKAVWALSHNELVMLTRRSISVRIFKEPHKVKERIYFQDHLRFETLFTNRLHHDFGVPAAKNRYQMIGYEFWFDIILDNCEPDLPLALSRPEFPPPKML